jgi:calreticulin
VKSEWKKEDGTAGEWNHTSGNWSGDAQDKGNRSEYFFFLMLTDFVLFCSVRRMLNS